METEITRTVFLERRKMIDLPLARRTMINRLAGGGFAPPVLHAMQEIPRHAFAPLYFWKLAYADNDLWLDETNLMAPRTVAVAAHHLGLNRQKKVLEIGTGTGYQSAVLSLLSQQVFTIERVASCVGKSEEAFSGLSIPNVSQRHADGLLGWPEAAPFDAIVLDAAVQSIPAPLLEQLNPSQGRMILPVGHAAGPQRLLLLQRDGGDLYVTDLGAFSYPPVIADSPPTREAIMAYSPQIREARTDGVGLEGVGLYGWSLPGRS